MSSFSRHDILLAAGTLMLAGLFFGIRAFALAGDTSTVIRLFYPFVIISGILLSAIVLYGYESYESDKPRFPF